MIAAVAGSVAFFFSGGISRVPERFRYLPPVRNEYGHCVYNSDLAFRTPGYPAVLVLTGFTITGSLVGVLVLQVATGAAFRSSRVRCCGRSIAGLRTRHWQ
jgi:hypothetical protein